MLIKKVRRLDCFEIYTIVRTLLSKLFHETHFLLPDKKFKFL